MNGSFLAVAGLALLLGGVARGQNVNVTLDNTDTIRSASATSDAVGDGQDFPGPNSSQSLMGLGEGGFSYKADSYTGTDMGSTVHSTANIDSEIDLNPLQILWTGSATILTNRFAFDSETSGTAKSLGDFFFDVHDSPVSFSLSGHTSDAFMSGSDVAVASIQLSGPNGNIVTLAGPQQTLTGTLAPGHYELQAVASANFDDMFPNGGNNGGSDGDLTLTFSGATTTQIPGDANHDGKVDFNDLLVLAQHYGLKTGQTYENGDFNADGGVGFDDLLILAQNYGRTSAAAVAPVRSRCRWERWARRSCHS